MADFKIKSTAGTGNLTLLQSQDQSGSDYAIKIGDSGASTLTNETLTRPTLTTPNLGTPSAITLTNATFPAGHIVQTVQNTYNGDHSAVKNGNTSERVVLSGNHHWTGQITNVGADNWVRVTMSFSFNFDRTDSNPGTFAGAGFSLWRESTEIMIANANSLYSSAHSLSGLWNFYWHYTLDYMDESPATGTNNYYLGYKSVDSDSQVRVRSSSSFEPFRCILQEIKK